MQGVELSKKMEGLSIAIPSLINEASDSQQVQKEFIKKESQKDLDGRSFVTERFREIRRGEYLPPFSELMQSEELTKNLSIPIPALINGASDSDRHERKQLQKPHQPSSQPVPTPEFSHFASLYNGSSPSSSRTKRENSMQFITPDRVRAAFVTLLQKEDFVNMIWPEILKEMLGDYFK